MWQIIIFEKNCPMKSKILRKKFGLTQEEMAMLTGVTRTQWSMYEIGQRELPTNAMLQLTTAFSYLDNLKAVAPDSQKIVKAEEEKLKELLQREKLRIEYKKLNLERKITAIQNKRAECFDALEVVHYIKTQSIQIHFPPVLEMIRIRATATLAKNPLHQVAKLQLKMDELDFVKKSLEQKLK